MDKESSIKLVFKHSLLYSAAAWSGRLFGVIQTPILTRVFAPHDYGVLDLIATGVAFLNLGLGLGLDSAFARHFSAADNDRDRQAYFGTAYGFRLLLQSIITILLCFNAAWIAKILLGGIEYRDVVLVASLSLVPSFLQHAFFTLLRYSMRAKTLSLLSVLSLATKLILVLLLVVALKFGVIGIYLATIINGLLFAGIAGFIVRNEISPVFSGQRLQEMLVFGLPLVPAGLAFFLITYSDRYFINYFMGLDEVGLYGVANRIAALITLVTSGFAMAWPPFMNSTFMEPEANRRFRRIFNLYSTVLFLLAISTSIFAVEIIYIFTTPQYVGAYIVVPLVLFSLVIYSIGDYFPVGISITRRTYHRAWIGGGAAAVNLIANYLLIPPFGIIGAGIATGLSYSFYCGLLLFVSERIYPVGFLIGRNLALWVSGAFVVAGVYTFQDIEMLWQQVLWKGAVALVLSSLPILFSVVTVRDLQFVRSLLRKYGPKTQHSQAI